MSEQERAPLRDVLANAKNELLEARRELERAREQIQSQRETIQQELDSLSKLRDALAADKGATKRIADESGKDWENFKTGLQAFEQLAQGLQEQHEHLLQLVRSKDENIKAALKSLNDATELFKENLDPDLDKKLEEIRKDQVSFHSASVALEQLMGEAAAGTQQIDELWKSIRDNLRHSHERLDGLGDVARKSHENMVSAGAIAQEIEKSFNAVEGPSVQLDNSLSEIRKTAESLGSVVRAEAKKLEELQKKQTSLYTAAAGAVELIKDTEATGRDLGDRSNAILEDAHAHEKLLHELAEAAKRTKSSVDATEALTQEIEKSVAKLEPVSRQIEESLSEIRKSTEPDSDRLIAGQKKLEEVQKKQEKTNSQLMEIADLIEATISVNGRIADKSNVIWENAQSQEKRFSELAEAAKNAHESMDSIENLLRKLQDTGIGTKGSLELLERDLAELRESSQTHANRLRTVVDGFSAKKTEGDKRLAEFSDSMTQTFNALTTSATESINQLQSELESVDKRRQNAADMLTQKARELMSKSETLAELSAVVGEKYAKAVDEIGSAGTLIDGLVTATKDAQAGLGQQETDLRKITESSDRIRTGGKQLQAELSTVQESITSLTSATAKLAHEESEQVQEFANLTASANESFAQLSDSAKQIKDMLDSYLTTAKDSRGKAMEALTAKREELRSSLETLAKSWQEAAKEYGEMAVVVDSAVKEIKLQREQYDASSRRLRDSFGKLLAERKALTEELAALRAEREKRLKARTQGVCPSCGRKVASNAVFCDRCGASLP